MGQADDAIAFARAQIGKPYVWAATGPDAYDCSGLVMVAYQHANPPIELVHWTYAMINQGVEVTRGELQPGDLVFPDAGHVQLYVGDGQIIEAQQSGVPIRQGPIWGFWRARRVVSDGKKSKGLPATAAGVIDAIPTPLTMVDAVNSAANIFRTPLGTLSKSQFWMRVGAFGVGTVLIIIGMLWWMRRPIESGIQSTMDAAKGLVSTAAQGAAFGIGAGGTGMGGGPSVRGSTGPVTGAPTSAPRTPPMPRTPPRAPAAVAPVTAPLPEFEAPRSPVHASAYVGRAGIIRPRRAPGRHRLQRSRNWMNPSNDIV